MKIKDLKLGPTGNFPEGKANAQDDGELRIAMAADNRQQVVYLHFGVPTMWIGVPANIARDMAKRLNELADQLDRNKM